MKEKLICLLSLLLLCSCDNKKLEDNRIVESLSVPLEPVSDHEKLSEIASDVHYISLETNDNALIDAIVRVIQQDSLVYVADRSRVYKYNQNGDLIATLSKSGGGSDQYTNISDFEVDAAGNVFVLSRSDRRLYKYGAENNLLDKIDFDCWVSNIRLVGDKTMFLYVGNETEGSNNKQLQQLDLSTHKISASFLDIDSRKSKYMHVKSDNYFSGGDGDTCSYFFQQFNDTIYKLSPHTGLSPAFYMDIANNNIPTSFFDREYRDIMDFFQNVSKNGYAYGSSLFAENPTSYLFSFYKLGQCYMALLPKERENKSLLFKGIKDDVRLFGYPIELNDLKMFMQRNGDLMVVLSPSEIFAYARERLSNEDNVLLNKIFKSNDEDQNPILLSIRLK